MNENWYRQLAQQRQRELLDEAKQARLLKEAGGGYPGHRAWRA
jgi:hypothetical protein